MTSKQLSGVDQQGELPLSRCAEPNDVPVDLLRRQRTAAAAFSLACQSSGLEDKEIYSGLAIDPGYFSRIKKGEATLQADVMKSFCRLVSNRIYPEWIAFSLGCTLVEIKSEAERRADAAERREAEAMVENKLMRQLLGGRVVA